MSLENQIKKLEPIQDDFSNNAAGITSFNQCMELGNILNDGKNYLVLGEPTKQIKIFRRDILQKELKINFSPVSIVTYYSMNPNTSFKEPYLAVAGGNYIFVYRNLKPSIKFSIPDQEINTKELEILKQYSNDSIDSKECIEKIKNLADEIENGTQNEKNGENDVIDDEKNEELKKLSLSEMSSQLLSLKSTQKQIEFLKKNKNKEIRIINYISCMSKIAQNLEGEESENYLLVGTEKCKLFAIDPKTTKIIKKLQLNTVPFIISSSGDYEGNHKILVGDRGCNIYIISKNEILYTIIIPQILINAFLFESKIYLCTIGQNYMGFSIDGEKEFNIIQPNVITCMEFARRTAYRENLSLIATKDNDLRIYKDSTLCYVLNLGDNAFGLKYGKFGDNYESIIILTYGGALLSKYFNKDIQLTSYKYEKEQDDLIKNTKLPQPKKTQLYVDLTNIEKENGEEIQNSFQKDLFRIRYKAMDTYVKMLKIGNAPQNYNSSTLMKVSVFLEGLGPNFKLGIVFSNIGKEPLANSVLTISYNRKVYSFQKENIQLSILMPNIPIKYSIPFKNISENGASGIIKIIVLDKNKNTPLIQTAIKVPISEMDIL